MTTTTRSNTTVFWFNKFKVNTKRFYNQYKDRMEFQVWFEYKSKTYKRKFIGGAYTLDVLDGYEQEARTWLIMMNKLLD